MLGHHVLEWFFGRFGGSYLGCVWEVRGKIGGDMLRRFRGQVREVVHGMCGCFLIVVRALVGGTNMSNRN